MSSSVLYCSLLHSTSVVSLSLSSEDSRSIISTSGLSNWHLTQMIPRDAAKPISVEPHSTISIQLHLSRCRGYSTAMLKNPCLSAVMLPLFLVWTIFNSWVHNFFHVSFTYQIVVICLNLKSSSMFYPYLLPPLWRSPCFTSTSRARVRYCEVSIFDHLWDDNDYLSPAHPYVGLSLLWDNVANWPADLLIVAQMWTQKICFPCFFLISFIRSFHSLFDSSTTFWSKYHTLALPILF